MRLHPPVSEEEAYAWLLARAREVWGAARAVELDASLRSLASALAALSGAVLPDELEPLFP